MQSPISMFTHFHTYATLKEKRVQSIKELQYISCLKSWSVGRKYSSLFELQGVLLDVPTWLPV